MVIVMTSPAAGPGAGGQESETLAGRSSTQHAAAVCGGSLPKGETLCAPFQKIKAVYDNNPAKFRTLQNILEVEKEMYGAEWPKVGATLALMWLKR